MKIVVYSKPFFPRMGGLERNTLTLCLALTDVGHKVQLVTETTEKDEADVTYPFPVMRSTSPWDLIEKLHGVSLFLVNGNISLRVLPFAWLRGVPYGIIYHSYRGYRRPGSDPRTRIGNQIRWLAARNAAANVFTNTYARTRSGLPEITSHVVLNPVDKRMAPLYRNDITQVERSFFLFAGRIIEGKGVFVLAEALSQLDGIVDLDVVIAGEGRDESTLRRRMQGLTTVDVQFAGRLDEAGLVEAYHRAKALLVPSTTHKEGNPLVVAEAIYAGTPVIASDQPPMVESVGEAGLIVSQGSSQELAGAIRRLHKDKQHYQMLHRSAQERADVFSYRRYKEEIASIVKTAADR
jgi:glycosyltransferase involved in cell wall biosynthesis